MCLRGLVVTWAQHPQVPVSDQSPESAPNGRVSWPIVPGNERMNWINERINRGLPERVGTIERGCSNAPGAASIDRRAYY
ncbi:hypothetical protein FJTKL_01454 [Diaporthe vaccinii]|uniref:Uncharacterized protein n=1 Tax=Diaporthe vaccinii TaxID=105482 RepID=A0ABR4E0E2_9PEZI